MPTKSERKSQRRETAVGGRDRRPGPTGASASRAYLRLVGQFRPRPIRSAGELNQAVAVVDNLLSRKQALLPEEEDYLEVLSELIERYEDEQEPVHDISGADMLRFLIEQRGLSQQQLAREVGIANSTISAVLNGRRELTLPHITTLAAYFSTEPAVFLPGN
jgi:HTH-type transcriptional regulator/antitoxin HigA